MSSSHGAPFKVAEKVKIEYVYVVKFRLIDSDKKIYALSHFLIVTYRKLINYSFNARFKKLNSSKFEILILSVIKINILKKRIIPQKKVYNQNCGTKNFLIATADQFFLRCLVENVFVKNIKSSKIFTNIFPNKHLTKKLILCSDWKILFSTTLVLCFFFFL